MGERTETPHNMYVVGGNPLYLVIKIKKKPYMNSGCFQRYDRYRDHGAKSLGTLRRAV